MKKINEMTIEELKAERGYCETDLENIIRVMRKMGTLGTEAVQKEIKRLEERIVEIDEMLKG